MRLVTRLGTVKWTNVLGAGAVVSCPVITALYQVPPLMGVSIGIMGVGLLILGAQEG